MSSSRPLTEIRADIDATDLKLLKLLNKRARLAEEVGRFKKASGGVFYVPERERSLIDELQAGNSGPFPTRAIRPVFQEIVSACLSLEAAVRVAYLGPEATFTHQAVKRHFGSSAQSVACGSISAVFEEVERGRSEFGVIPVENSTEGAVSHTLDSFVTSALVITAEVVVDIDHCLLARRGTERTDLERVYSHPQALGQCRSWLESNLPGVAWVESPSTAEAARAVLADPHGAAVASKLAARLYNLDILQGSIQDRSDNVTRFLVVGNKTPARDPEVADYKTTLCLVLPDSAGALYHVLEPLSRAGINLTKIESRPSRQRAWDYVFFLDLDGHRDDPAIARVLEQLTTDCELVKVLGSYRAADAV